MISQHMRQAARRAWKLQEAAREHDKALRQTRAKLQRAEGEAQAAKQAAAAAAARVQELEAAAAHKDVQLEAAVQQVGGEDAGVLCLCSLPACLWCFQQRANLLCHSSPAVQVSLMQHELEALRQGLSGRQAAALEAARGEFAGALQEAQAELETARQRACEHGLTAARQGKALAAIMRVLAVHAGEEASVASGEDGVPGSAAGEADTAGPDPSKALAFAEAVSAAMLDLQQQWQLERAEMAQVGGGCACWHLLLLVAAGLQQRSLG